MKLKIYDTLNDQMMALEDIYNEYYQNISPDYWRTRELFDHWCILSDRIWDVNKSFNAIDTETDIEGMRIVRHMFVMLALEALQGADIVSTQIAQMRASNREENEDE